MVLMNGMNVLEHYIISDTKCDIITVPYLFLEVTRHPLQSECWVQETGGGGGHGLSIFFVFSSRVLLKLCTNKYVKYVK